jgi:ubiquinone/menaquinone biosynthesis C-methylase UbiE
VTSLVSEPTLPVMMSPEAMTAVEQRLEGLLEDVAGAMVSVMCSLGDRLGLFRALADDGPATSAELAVRAGVDERYVREWLHCLAAAGYLDVDRSTGRFTLPAPLALALATEGSPFSLVGGYQLFAALVDALPVVAEAFRTGDGVPQSRYGEDVYIGMERVSASWLDAMLVSHWVPAIPDLAARLGEGARVADIGCGGGRALIRLAQAYPNSLFIGYDSFADNVVRARAAAETAGVGDLVEFVNADAGEGLSGPLDLVTAFEVLHDTPNLPLLLARIRKSLTPGGVLLLLESQTAGNPLDNRGPAATVLYATSTLYCVPTALAAGADGLGTMGLSAEKIRDLCGSAGFRSVRPLPSMNPFNALYEIRA